MDGKKLTILSAFTVMLAGGGAAVGTPAYASQSEQAAQMAEIAGPLQVSEASGSRSALNRLGIHQHYNNGHIKDDFNIDVILNNDLLASRLTMIGFDV